MHNKGNYKQGEKTDFRTEKIIASEVTKKARIYNGEKTISLISGAGKNGQPLVKE